MAGVRITARKRFARGLNAVGTNAVISFARLGRRSLYVLLIRILVDWLTRFLWQSIAQRNIRSSVLLGWWLRLGRRDADLVGVLRACSHDARVRVLIVGRPVRREKLLLDLGNWTLLKLGWDISNNLRADALD